ncbi:MAG: ExeA family protein [Gammaproteobacteria bacterium]
MYESFYGFKERPFALLPDPTFLYLASQHSNALAMLEYGLASQAGFTVITGEIGCGKTTLIRHLLNNVDRDVTVGLLSNTQRSIGELLQWVLLAFGLDYHAKEKVALYQTFYDFVIDEYSRNRRTVLIIDEAQNLGAETLEELRMLSNVNADKDLVLQLILVGQPELREILRGRELVQFAQRIAVDYYLPPLTRVQATEYIGHRLKVAGGDPKLFDSGACDILHTFSCGIPRLINILCDTALVYGYAAQAQRIDVALVREVLADKADSVLFSQRRETRKIDIRRSELQGEAECRPPFEDNDATAHEVLRDLFSSLRAKP